MDDVKESSGPNITHHYTQVTEIEKVGTVQNSALLINFLSMFFFFFSF